MAVKRREEGDRQLLFTRRALLLAGGKVALLGALGARLYWLQVVEQPKYQTLAEENRINMRLLGPARGLIFDRNGAPLAANRNNFRVLIAAKRARDAEPALDRLEELLGLEEADRRRIQRELQRSRNFTPVTVRENLSWDEVARIEFNVPDLPGVSIELGQTRDYLHPELMSHIIGYVARVSEDDLKNDTDPVLTLPGIRIGKKGVERGMEEDLRGRAGAVQVEVNAVGRVVRELDRIEGEAGSNALLTVDLGLQEFVANRLKDESASAVVLDVITGEILAMVSVPGFDPNAFARGISQAEWRDLNENPMRPLYNKALAGVYPPGSTYKMVTALAALDSKVIDPWTRLPCAGFLELGDIRFHCWLHAGHGALNVVEALQQSCDCFFYEAARRAGVDRMYEAAYKLGFGQRLEPGVPGEAAGVQPTRAWKLDVHGQNWAHGDTFNLGIGQGYMLATPMQLAVMTARLVNGGYEVKPRFLLAKAAARDELGPPPVQTTPTAPRMRFNAQHIAMVKQGMDLVVNSQQGTAWPARIKEPGLSMGGKTGTAQVKRITERERQLGITQEQLPWHLRHHALFVGYGPVESPRYACSVIVEHGMGGGRTAAPAARDILAETMKRDPSRSPQRFRRVASLGGGGR
jgi:penicillin-binding protein 2